MFAPRIPVAIALCAALAATACSRESAAHPPYSVVLITLDTTRCDALGCYGGTKASTPFLDALAADSVRYERAHTVLPLTLPAHSSMFTGLYPPRHTVRGNGPATLPAEALTLAERARAAGYQTGGFIGGLTLDKAYGAAQGFEAWSQPAQRPERMLGEISDRPAREVVSDARAWLARRDRSRPFLLWVHVFDAHAPYAPPPGFERSHPYYGEVSAADAALGELVLDLQREGLLARTLVCVVADHGESLGDHGEDTHGLHAWESTLRVPFFVRHPDRWRAGEASDELVSVVDVQPTLLEAMGIGVPAEIDGVSLFRRHAPAERGLYFETFAGWARFGWSPLAGWIDAQGKYVHGATPRFFRIGVDPGESRDEIGALGAGLARYRVAIARVLAAPRIASGPARLAPTGAGAALAELGYGGADELEPEWPDPLAPALGPDPVAMLDEYRDYTRAQTLSQIGRAAEAIPILERVVGANPANLHALDELGLALVETGQWERAALVLEERAARPPARLGTHQRLVRCYTELGRAEQARAHTLRALELLIETHERRGEPEQAAHFRMLHAQGLAQ